MADFKYKGRDALGKAVTGQIMASSESDAAKLLISKGTTPLDIQPIKPSVFNATEGFLSRDIFNGNVKFTELIMFSRQMAALIKAGMPISVSLLRLAETTKSKTLRDTLMGVSQEVQSGKTLSLSIGQYPQVFSPIFVSMIDTGEHSGKLDEAFFKLTEYLELESSVKKRIKTIMRYPTIVITAIIVALVIINIMVIPSFANMFKRFGQALPLPTKILLATSDFFIHYWPHILVGCIVTLFLLRYYVKTPKGRYIWDRFKLRMPLFGNIIMQVLLMRFSSLFAMIFRSGVPLTEGMGLVANSVGNDFIKKHIMNIRKSIEGGESFFSAAKSCNLFPPLVTQMIAVGEESGTLDTMLEQVADFYEREVDYNIKRLGDLMEPILLVIIAGMVLILALGVFLPMWDIATFRS